LLPTIKLGPGWVERRRLDILVFESNSRKSTPVNESQTRHFKWSHWRFADLKSWLYQK